MQDVLFLAKSEPGCHRKSVSNFKLSLGHYIVISHTSSRPENLIKITQKIP